MYQRWGGRVQGRSEMDRDGPGGDRHDSVRQLVGSAITSRIRNRTIFGLADALEEVDPLDGILTIGFDRSTDIDYYDLVMLLAR